MTIPADGAQLVEQQVQALLHETVHAPAALAEVLRRNPVNAPTGDTGNYFAITGDLWRRCAEHCRSVALLLDLGGWGPAIVVNRAAYEVAVNLMYVVNHGNKVENAVHYRARSLLEVADFFGSQPAGQEAKHILDRLPARIVEEARRRRRDRRPWSGKTLKEMAEAIGVIGHDTLYGFMSWEAHGRIAGYDVVEKSGEGDIRVLEFSRKVTDEERAALASNARLTLRTVYNTLGRDWVGMSPPQIPGPPLLFETGSKTGSP